MAEKQIAVRLSPRLQLHVLIVRLDRIARTLQKRNKAGHVPSKPVVQEVYDIADELRVLEGKLRNP
jgi:hypothetical protein